MNSPEGVRRRLTASTLAAGALGSAGADDVANSDRPTEQEPVFWFRLRCNVDKATRQLRPECGSRSAV